MTTTTSPDLLPDDDSDVNTTPITTAKIQVD